MAHEGVLHGTCVTDRPGREGRASARPPAAWPDGTILDVSTIVKLVERAPQRVAYMRHVGPYGDPISRFWIQQVAPRMAADGLMGHARYGISHDDPSIADPAQCRYDACVEVAAEYTPSSRALITTLPGGRYAQMPFKGTGREVSLAWTRVLRDWLPASQLQPDGRPCFEYYPPGSTHDPATGVFDCQICIPVAPL
jgi:AraC family transcriptional regulator